MYIINLHFAIQSHPLFHSNLILGFHFTSTIEDQKSKSICGLQNIESRKILPRSRNCRACLKFKEVSSSCWSLVLWGIQKNKMCQLETLEMSLLIAIDSPKWINYEHNKSESLIKSHSPSLLLFLHTKIICKTFHSKTNKSIEMRWIDSNIMINLTIFYFFSLWSIIKF